MRRRWLLCRRTGRLSVRCCWTTGKLRRDPGQPVSALVLSQFGRESVAERLPETPGPDGTAER